MSCRVTTTVSTSSSASERNGVALTRTVTDPAIGDAQDYLLGPHRLAPAQHLGQGKVREGHCLSIEAPDGQDLEQVFRGTVRQRHGLHEPHRLPVEGERRSRPGVEDRDTDGRGVDKRLQARPGEMFVPVTGGRWR